MKDVAIHVSSPINWSGGTIISAKPISLNIIKCNGSIAGDSQGITCFGDYTDIYINFVQCKAKSSRTNHA